ncbi:tryptophan-rich sensory protein [Ornithinimicrobium sufpigmenti]|uniref:tryptophan-rich sensory protein n=1 Tax=Ornithinimicrobium sufpigmenti TaxID=2508882 RepID=UPI001035BC06|nr:MULTISPECIES: tryptophan-rich sensory protein [unclassified Ornithinimicrobium]
MGGRRALVTGATGYVGGLLVPRLLQEGWSVRVLTRNADRLPAAWRDDVEVVEGDAGSADDLDRALAPEGEHALDVAYYLLHSMDGDGDFVARDRRLARKFGAAARRGEVRRLVYLSGLHPDGTLSAHLASRVEVGRILLGSGVPSAVLQAATIIGDGSVSFAMLRHLTTRLPVMVAPRWLRNRIQPIAIDDVLHYLVRAAELPPEINRTFDIGGPDVLTYEQMMQVFAQETGQRRRLIATLPVLTPRLASHWVGLVTPVDAGVAKPLVGSLVHEVVCREDDILALVGPPPGGRTAYRDAVREAMSEAAPDTALRRLGQTAAAVTATSVLGGLATAPDNRWYRRLDKPAWQPPAAAFPIVWATLYADIALVSGLTLDDLDRRAAGEGGDARRADRKRRAYERALGINLALNASWSASFFRARRPALAAAHSAALAVSAADLARRAGRVRDTRGWALAPYAAWCAFATVLSGELARRNR